MKILIVDDNKENLYLLDAMLKGSGYDVAWAVNGREALEKLRSEAFNMIISDILMPVMDGFTLCKECKRDEKLQNIPFLFYTATYKDKRDEELALKLGADKYLLKPMEPEGLLAIIQGLLRDSGKSRISYKSPDLEEEEEIFKLYSERLIKKLEKKMLDLESETTLRKAYSEKLERVNRLLYAIRSINQIIVKENDRQRLIQTTCDDLIKIGGYYYAWLALFDDSGRLTMTAEAGLEGDFGTLVQRLKRGDSVFCVQQALKQADPVVIEDRLSICGDCPLVERHDGSNVIAIRLEHDNKMYGVLVASTPAELGRTEDEQSLIRECAMDIAFSLAGMATQEQKRQVNDMLIQSEEKWRTIFDSANDGMIVADPQNWMLYDCNKAFCQMTGYSDEEIKKMAIGDLHSKEVLPDIIEKFELQFKEERSLFLDIPVKRKDGTIFYADVNSGPLTFGGRTYNLGIFRDASQRRGAETLIRESEEKYQTLFEDSMDAIYTTTRDGEFVDVNQAMSIIFGYEKEEMIGMSILKIYVDPDDQKKFQREIERKGYVRDYEIMFHKKDGTEIDCLLNSNLWKDNQGNILGYKGIAHDITERKQIERERQKHSEDLQRTVSETINVIALIAEMRDPYTAGHQRQVAKLASAIAEEMGLPREKIETIRVAGTLHDIGKVQIPSEILSKPGRLNEIEMNLIKSHPQVGYDIVNTIKLAWPVCPIILQHHERMDGSGYPKGLLGEDICLESRILAVADVVEAMASHRPYRPALGIDKALKEISLNKAKLYDPDVVDACSRLFHEKRFEFE